MRNYYYYTGDRLPIDDPKLDNETAHRQMQRLLADKISNLAPVDELRMLLVSGARADDVVSLGLRPLHYACYRDYFDAAKLLIVRGAKVDSVDEVGFSPLHLCAEKGYSRMLKLLLEHLVNRSKCVSFDSNNQPYPIREGADEPLRLAILQEHYECARLLLESGANPNIHYFDGPQITLVPVDKIAYIRLLLEFGANPDVQARNGMTVLMKCCELGALAYKTTELLIEHKADLNFINFKSNYPMTALYFAVSSGHYETLKLLLEHGAKPDQRERLIGRTQSSSFPSVLHFAIMANRLDMVKILLKFGANVEVADSIYGNALHLSACYRIGTENQSEMVKLLLEHGSNPNALIVNSNGAKLRTPTVEFFRRLYKFSIESTEQTDWVKIAQLLFAYGARFAISPENLDIAGMALPPSTQPHLNPSHADSVNYFLTRIASSFENLDDVEEENAIYATKKQIEELKNTPQTLAQITRNYIRNNIKVCPATIDKFPVPFFIKDFLLGCTDLPFC
ncbi:SOCS box domain-containing protein [Aphelenchoides bicaudatus]|nr:SOCS box domain-containing protein [Aphelenchoides bicaudatus]